MRLHRLLIPGHGRGCELVVCSPLQGGQPDGLSGLRSALLLRYLVYQLPLRRRQPP